MSTSFWLPSTHQITYPSLEHSITDEILVVGGCFSGLVAALRLLKAGYSVSLLEANTIGLAASRSAGVLASSLERDFIDYINTYGFDTAKRLWTFSVMGVEAVKALCLSLNIPVENTGSLYISYPEDIDYLKKETDARLSAGFEANFLENINNPLYEDGAALALETPADGLVNPYELCKALEKAAIQAGLKIYENSRVTAINNQTCNTMAGKITAKKIVLAGQNIPDQLGYATTNVNLLSFCLSTAPLTNSQINQLGLKNRQSFWDADMPFFYGRLTPNNCLLLGGDDLWKPMQLIGLNKVKLNRLEKRFREKIPLLQDVEITHKWAGDLTVTSDALPTIGKKDNIYLAGNCAGISQAVMAGNLLAEMIITPGTRIESILDKNRKISFLPRAASSKELFHLVLEVLGIF